MRVSILVIVSLASFAASGAGMPQRDGQKFRDAMADRGNGPWMVVVPAGQFQMGSPDGEAGREPREGPRHSVSVRRFALAQYEVTRGEFAAFVQATGYRTDAERQPVAQKAGDPEGCFVRRDSGKIGWTAGKSWKDVGYPQEDDHPVACVSWNDASAYVAWLREQTGKRYRLPTEAEQEYTIRARTTTPWPWGRDPDGGCRYANGADESAEDGVGFFFSFIFASSGCDDGFVFTAPVGRLEPNAFALFDTIGNVNEWSQDCATGGYVGAPDDGSAWQTEQCTSHMLRGSSWSDEPVWLRSSIRLGMPASFRYHNVGFRVARDPDL